MIISPIWRPFSHVFQCKSARLWSFVCQVPADANERGPVVSVFRMMFRNKRKHLGKMPNCSNVQDARTCMGWTYFPWPLPSSSSSSSSSSFSLELYRFHRHTFAFYFLYIQTHLSLFLLLPSTAPPIYPVSPRLPWRPLLLFAGREPTDTVYVSVALQFTLSFSLPLLPRSSLLWAMNSLEPSEAITNERKSDTAWTFPSICIRIPEIFPLFSFVFFFLY